MLEIKGHKIIDNAYDGEECIKIFNHLTPRTYPDIIIMDHRMPKKDGLETTKELIITHPELKIIFLSADKIIKKKRMQLVLAQ